jgi:6-pyruvoyltetrahydropterin/6-carboxytetrahydropterin synthase
VLITGKVELDAAHCLSDHSSKCYNIHGHRYVVEAYLKGPILDQPGTSSHGMIMDFGHLKELLTEIVHGPADHGLIMDINDRRRNMFCSEQALASVWGLLKHSLWAESITEHYQQKMMFIDGPPTAERLASLWAEAINVRLMEKFAGTALVQLKVWETPKYSAIWQITSDLEEEHDARTGASSPRLVHSAGRVLQDWR